eukprot:1181082-Prymnesium_polylepis.2
MSLHGSGRSHVVLPWLEAQSAIRTLQLPPAKAGCGSVASLAARAAVFAFGQTTAIFRRIWASSHVIGQVGVAEVAALDEECFGCEAAS